MSAGPQEASDRLAAALRAVEPAVTIKTTSDGDTIVSAISLDGVRMTLRTDYYADVVTDEDHLHQYAERVVERLRSEKPRR